jgi:hypothetical protein
LAAAADPAASTVLPFRIGRCAAVDGKLLFWLASKTG